MKNETYLREQIKKHPSARPADLVKLLYQARYGAEHLLTDIPAAREYFMREFSSVPADDADLFEEISPDYARVNFSAWKKKDLPPEWLFRMFALTASRPVQTEQAAFSPIHHSEVYREKEHPAYRIVSLKMLRLLPVLKKLSEMPPFSSGLPEEKKNILIAVDGRAASGKTTLADELGEVLDAGLIRMDDFFLPAKLRTETRLQEAGGNIDYDRFIAEVLPGLVRGKEIIYRPFDCGTMDFSSSRKIPVSRYRIVEGAYSLHPKFGHYADLSVFCDVSPDEQRKRILLRNGEEMAERFRTEWIPMEENYIRTFRIKETADIFV